MSDLVRHNPFVGYDDSEVEVVTSAVLTPWVWNLKGLVRGGGDLSFNDLKHRPGIYRPLLSALWSNNVECIPPLAYSTFLLSRFYLRSFERYLASHSDPAVRDLSSLEDLKREMLIDCRRWMHEQFAPTTAAKAYGALVTLLTTLQHEKSPIPGAVPRHIDIPRRPLRHTGGYSNTVNPYSADEEAAIVGTCKKAINVALGRLNDGRRLLAQGTDPRTTGALVRCRFTDYSEFTKGWENVPNILWYIVRVMGGRMPNTNHPEGAVEPLLRFLRSTRSPIRKMDAYKLLYPHGEDLLPFIMLLSLKTGLNAESILTLKRDCLKGSDGNMTIVEFSKTRGSHELMCRKFSHRGANSPVGLIKTVLQMTEVLVPNAEHAVQNELWLAHQMSQGRRDGIIGRFSNKVDVLAAAYVRVLINGRSAHRNKPAVPGFMARNEIRSRNGEKLNFSFMVARKTNATTEYLKHGNLANVSKKTLKHHGKQGSNTTALHYLTNEATHHVHDKAVRNAQDQAVMEARRVVVTGERPEEAEVAVLAKELSVTEEKVISILSGEQDVFIASCRDFYNKPNGIPNSACDDVWECFGCSNALWTTRILPRVIKFLWFVEEQRLLLDPVDWSKKFNTPYIAITKDILPRFQTRTIEWAKAEAKETPFYVPPHLRDA